MGALGEELGRLRPGRGIMAENLPERLGPTLCDLAGIDISAHPVDIRKQLIEFLDGLAAELPEDLRTAFAAALALREDVRFRFLDKRMEWLADRLHRDPRTARRRADEAIRQVEGAATRLAKAPREYDDWYLARLETLLLLDRTEPVAIEDRIVVAARDDLAEISVATSIPVPSGRCVRKHPAELELRYGGTLIERTWPTATYLRYVIRLPRPLRRGQSHEFGVSLTTPRDQPFNPRYAIQPLRRCDEFALRIRFGPAAQVRSVWRIAGLPRGMADDFSDPDALVQPDTVGDIRPRYQRLKTGLVYGARWS